jgi:hypothetical protein
VCFNFEMISAERLSAMLAFEWQEVNKQTMWI